MSDQLSKYHQEKAGSSSGGPQDSENPKVGGSGSPASVLNPGNMGNPMMNMKGGKVPTGMETDSKNPMMPVSGGGSSQLPDVGQVYANNPQGHKKAPLAGKLLGKR